MSNQLDVPSMDMLLELNKEMDNRDTELWLARLHGPVRDALAKGGYLHQIGLIEFIDGVWMAFSNICRG